MPYRLLLLCFCICSCMSLQKRVQIAEAQLLELQNSSENFKQVIHIPDAVFTLVHIQQTHYSAIYQKNLLNNLPSFSTDQRLRAQEAYFSLINEINSQQKQVIDFCLRNRTFVDCLYVEGLSYPGTYKNQNFESQIVPSLKGVKEILNYEKQDFTIPSPPYFTGASLFLYHKHQFPVTGVEHTGLLRFTHKLYSGEQKIDGNLSGYIKEAHEEREKFMIEYMARNLAFNNKYDSSIKFLLCGEAHDFKNNIIEWNQLNPDRQFNLFIWTPSP